MSQVSVVRQGEGQVLNVLGSSLRFVCRGEETGHAWSMMEAVLPKDTGPPPHHHAWDEAYYCVSGEIEFDLDGRRERVRAGDFVYAPGGTVHAFHGVSDEPARLLVFDAPAHAASFFVEIDREVVNLPEDLAKTPAIGARNGVVFDGPPG